VFGLIFSFNLDLSFSKKKTKSYVMQKTLPSSTGSPHSVVMHDNLEKPLDGPSYYIDRDSLKKSSLGKTIKGIIASFI
jgi:hypothetical protein